MSTSAGRDATQNRFRGCLLGLAVGDAIGTTVEFCPRGTFAPVSELLGGGPFGLTAGRWTDDTSMALCLATSLLEAGFDLRDQIERYCRWYEEGYWSSTGRCFDIGNTVRTALEQYRRTGNPAAGSTDPRSAGNGCIMRLAPVPMFFFPSESLAAEYSAQSCLPTHGTVECVDAARLLGRALVRALAGSSKSDVLAATAQTDISTTSIAALASGSYLQKPELEIRGSGYVVECLEAALWCFAHAGSFEDAILRAVNLGDDADTTAAVCGQLAGAFFGATAIPARWLDRLHLANQIAEIADSLYRCSAHPARSTPALRL